MDGCCRVSCFSPFLWAALDPQPPALTLQPVSCLHSFCMVGQCFIMFRDISSERLECVRRKRCARLAPEPTFGQRFGWPWICPLCPPQLITVQTFPQLVPDFDFRW